jgi:hypothetical protein
MAALYQLPGDNLAAGVTPTVSTGSIDAAYPAANITDGNPAKPAKFTGAAGSLVFDFGAAKAMRFVAVFNHSCSAITLQGNASDAWGAPSFSQAFSILAAREDGFSFNPWQDLTVPAPSYRYWRLVFTAASIVAVGEVWFSLTVRTWPNSALNSGGTTGESHPVVEQRTRAGVALLYDGLTTTRSIKVPQTTVDTDRAALATLWRSSHGRAKPFVFVRDTTIADAMLVRLASTRETLKFSVNADTETLTLEELSPGLPF